MLIRTLVEYALALIGADLPKALSRWAEAKPIRFGCKIYVNDGKLDERTKAGKFMGYDSESKGYRVYWPDTHRVPIEQDIKFAPTLGTTARFCP
jgi:hypothetical protein